MSEEVTVKISKEQAGRLWTNAMLFFPDWRKQGDRFEVYGANALHPYTEVADNEWTFHWCASVADAVLLQAWFEGQGIACKALFDTASIDHDPYVVLANVTIGSDRPDYWGAV